MNKPQTTPTVTRADLIAAIEIAQDAVTGKPSELNLFEIAAAAKIEADRVRSLILVRAEAADWSTGAAQRTRSILAALQPGDADSLTFSTMLESSPEVAAARELLPPLFTARDAARKNLADFDIAAEASRQALRDALALHEKQALASPEISKLRAEVEAMAAA